MSGKDRRSREKSKEDTWKASELKTYINPDQPATTTTTTTTTTTNNNTTTTTIQSSHQYNTNATRRGSNRDRSDNPIGHDVTPKSKGGVTSKAESLRANKPPLDKVVRHDIGSNEQKRGTERHEDRFSTKDRITGDLSMQVVKRRGNDEIISDHVRGNEHLQRLKDQDQRAQIEKTKDKTRYRSEERAQIEKTKDKTRYRSEERAQIENKTRYRSEERTQIEKTKDKTRSNERIQIEKDSSEILKGSDHRSQGQTQVQKTSQSKHKSKQHEQSEKEIERRHTSQERELSKNITSQSKHKFQEKDKIDRTSQSKHRSQKREQIHKTGDQSRTKSLNQAHIEKTSQSKNTLQEKEQNATISQSKLRSKLGGHLFEKRQADMTGSTSSLKNMSPSKISERYKFDANRRTSSEQNLISTQNVISTLNFDRIQPVQDENSQNDISEDLPSNQSDDNISDSGAKFQNFNKFDQKEDDENTSYIDDFEVYDEDFEEIVSSQDEMNSRENDFDDENDSDEMTGVKLDMNEILAAIDQENQSISAVKSVNEYPHNESESSSETDFQITQTGRTFINFHSSKMEIENREINLQVQSRSNHLKSLIELDFANFDIFNLEPETDYEIYIKHFGFSLSNQVAIQCCQEVFDREQQTDEIISREKWIQHAENGVHLTGGGDGEDETTVVAVQIEKNTQRFLKFFEKASQVICILLEENTAQARNSKLESQNSAETDQESIFEFSTPNYFSLKNPPILEGRDINYVHISNIQPNSVLISYSTVLRTVDNNLSIFNRNGVIALWNINDPNRPKKILVCETDAKVCAFSPQKLSMAFAGLSDGSIVLWDLGENQEHFLKEFRHHEIPLRTPTYSTAMLFESGGHLNPICTLEVIYSKTTTTTTTTTTTEIQNNEEIEYNATAYDNNVIGGLSFQIASLDTKGVINIWVISEVFTIEKHGSLSDLKLAPGGRLKLTRATSISIVSPIRANSKINSLINSTLLKFHPEDANHYYIGAENGLVIHGVRHAGKYSPKAYFIENNHQSVSSIEFHPWLPDYFAVGYRFSCFAIYNRKSKCPVFTVNDFDLTIIQLFWSKTNPSQLFILSEDGLVSLWDLLVDTYRPIAKGSVVRNENDWLMIVDIKLIPKRSHAKKSGEIIISYSDGTSEIHVLKDMRDSLATGDLNEFKSFLATSQIFTKTI